MDRHDYSGEYEIFPAQKAVAFVVSCQADPTGAQRHPVVLFPDWSVDTGLDPEAERIAVASGVRSKACPDLAERVIPAIRDTWTHRSRRSGADVRFDRELKRWVPVKRAPTCEFAARTWLSAGEAAAHLRDLRHWAHMHRADPETVRRVWDAIGDAIGGWPDTDRIPDSMLSLVNDQDDALMLWRAGVHPEWAAELAEQIPVDEPLLATTYIHVMSQGVDLDWLAGFAPYGARAVDWAARTWNEGDPHQLRAPQEWLDAGFPCWSIGALVGGPYTPEEVQGFAQAMGGTMEDAAEYVARWLEAGCVPTMEQLATLWAMPNTLRVAPSTNMINDLQHRLDPWRVDLPMTDLGLILAACGSLSVAVELLQTEKVGSGQEVIDRFRLAAD